MDSSFIARPVRLFGIGLAAIFFGCNSAPQTPRNSEPSSVQVDGGNASAAAVDTGAAGAGGAGSPAAASGGAAGHPDVAPGGGAGAMSDPSAGAAGMGAVAISATDPSDGGAIAISATDPTGGGGGATVISTTDPSGGGSGGATAVSTTDPSSGADGGAPVCEGSEMRCFEGCTETCQPDGAWGPAISCPGHKTCGGSPGQAKCVCKVDDLCGTTTGPICDSDTSFTTCVKDEDGCIFRMPTTKCAHACEGVPGAALCAEGPCTTVGETRCESSFAQGTCTATASGGPSFVTSACAAGTVCGRNAPARCKDPNWADWPMPNGIIDVANGAPNPQRFTDNGDGSVTDNVTGLDWAWVTFDAQTLADASDICKGMHLLDEGDWRVPSLIELISIADFGEPSNINGTFFPPPHDLQRWTTTLRGDGSDEHFSFNFALGQVSFIDDESQDALHPHAINCVR